jgi:hypothetical protein
MNKQYCFSDIANANPNNRTGCGEEYYGINQQ